MKIDKVLASVMAAAAVVLATVLVSPAFAQDKPPVVVGYIGSFA